MIVPRARLPMLRWQRGLKLSVLMWLAIILPVGFLTALDIVRHTYLSGQSHGFPDFFLTYGLLAAASVAFGVGIFKVIAVLQGNVSEQNRRLNALNEIAAAAADDLDSSHLQVAALDRVLDVMSATAGLICVVDLKRGEHSAVRSTGFSAELTAQMQRAKIKDDPVAQEVIRTGRAVIFDKVLEDPRVRELARREGIRSGISTPLKSEGEITGILVVATRTKRRFSRDDQTFLDSVGAHLGVAIRKADLFKQVHVQNQKLSALVAVGNALSSAVELNVVLDDALETILTVFGANAAEAWLLDDSGRLEAVAHCGEHRDAFAEITTMRLGQGLPGLVARDNEPIVVHDLPSDGRFLRRGVLDAGFHTFVALPMRYGNSVVGVICVAAYSPSILGDGDDLMFLEAVGEQVGVAVENARLHRRMQDVATLEERERIAREMHDGLAQVLGYINTQTLAIKKMLADGRVDAAGQEISKIEDLARELYADVREGILGLRTRPSGNGGLLPALREYIERYSEMSGIRARLEVGGPEPTIQLGPSAEVQLMRIIQEALTNVRKHASATEATVTLSQTNNGFCAEIADNGVGFEPSRLDSVGRPRFGLSMMEERAVAIGGRLTVESTLGRGTKVQLHLSDGSGPA